MNHSTIFNRFAAMPPITDSARAIFISYSRKDVAAMARVRDSLRAEGLSVWTDERLVPGTPEWEREIESAIKSSGGVIVLLSASANESTWVRREIAFAEAFSKRIFPVLVGGDEQSAVPARLINHQRVDIRRAGDYEAQISRLIDALCAHVGIERESARRARQAQENRRRRESAERVSQIPAPPLAPQTDNPARESVSGATSIFLTLATWLPLALPLIGAVTGAFPYSSILIPTLPAAAWLAALIACLVLLFALDRLLPNTDHWSDRAAFGFLGVSGLVALLFGAVIAYSLFGRLSGVGVLLSMAVASMTACLTVARRFATSGATVPPRNVADVAVGNAMVGGLVGIFVSFLLEDSVPDMMLLKGIGFALSAVAGVIAFVVLSFAMEQLTKADRRLPRALWALYALALAAEVVLVFGEGWKTL
ncbi:MAG: toll/interleukin-1 receptor domain-containing protein [Anaerolineae bacterium]|nr:toll/interleukin-1 receptor domain-containing protein [Anaerolineae bacterium]NUQ04582.1 toll/interleukin-1 receptor domain-containing protein [Anaerolineae bacterium]